MKKVLLIGASKMAESYFDVLTSLNIDFDVVCRSEASAKRFNKSKGLLPYTGGASKYLKNNKIPSHAILAVEVDSLASLTLQLIESGIKSILTEKPAGLFFKEIKDINNLASKKNCNVFVAYNRRFYSSVNKLIEFGESDGGISSISFDFTEWSDSIAPLQKGPNTKERWLLSNSTHVIDLAFFLAGKPDILNSNFSGSLKWHPSGSCFSGSGITARGIIFNYRADWDAPGRWGLVAYTKNYKMELAPLEQLVITERNSVVSKSYNLEDNLDIKFKPGLYNQVASFLSDCHDLCSISEQLSNYDIYTKIAGYKK